MVLEWMNVAFARNLQTFEFIVHHSANREDIGYDQIVEDCEGPLSAITPEIEQA